jgi:hypothetical protein
MKMSPLRVDPLWVTPVAANVMMPACMAGANRQRPTKQIAVERT